MDIELLPVRPLGPADEVWATDLLIDVMSGPPIASRGVLYDGTSLPGLVAEVEDPFALATQPGAERVPLELGLFVQASIAGRTPKPAIHESPQPTITTRRISRPAGSSARPAS